MHKTISKLIFRQYNSDFSDKGDLKRNKKDMNRRIRRKIKQIKD